MNAQRATNTLPDLCRTVLSALPDAAFALDGHGRVLAANDMAASRLLISEGQQIAQSLRAPSFLVAIATAVETHRPASFELDVSVPAEQHLTGTATPIGQTDGAEAALLVILRDLTDQRQLAEMRADFVANASHELRTPLASLKGFIETLQGAAKDDPVARARFLAIMQDEAGRMARLIEDLLSLSRIEMHEHVAPRGTVGLAEIVDSVVNAMQPLSSDEGRRLAVRAIDRPAHVFGDRDEIAQVVQNLIHNAIKYGRSGGRVDVSVRRDGPNLALIVTDDGIGIAPEHVPRLTERFYRVSAKESRERGGTGLGLAIVKHIVNRHRGELRVESQPGKGSTFTVLLPAAPGGGERS